MFVLRKTPFPNLMPWSLACLRKFGKLWMNFSGRVLCRSKDFPAACSPQPREANDQLPGTLFNSSFSLRLPR